MQATVIVQIGIEHAGCSKELNILAAIVQSGTEAWKPAALDHHALTALVVFGNPCVPHAHVKRCLPLRRRSERQHGNDNRYRI